MAIWAYTGLPRHGKSYHAVKDQVLPAIKAGRRVVTNIPLNADAIRSMAGEGGEIVQVSNEALAADPEGVIARECTPGSLCLFDELWRFLPAGMTAKNAPQAWKSLFAEHGHKVADGVMMQIVLVVQDLAMVAAFARQLVERTIVVRKMTVIGSNKRYRVDVYAGAVTGTNPPQGRRLNEGFGKFEADVFACYTSRTMSEGDASGSVDEAVLDKRGTIWRHPYVRYGVPIAALLFLWGIYRVVGFFGGDAGGPEHQSAAAEVVAPVRRFSQMSAPPTTQAVVARISGVLRGESDASSRVLLEDAGFYRWVSWYAARCRESYDGVVRCDYEGKRYAFDVDVSARRPAPARAGIGQILGVSADAGRPRE